MCVYAYFFMMKLKMYIKYSEWHSVETEALVMFFCPKEFQKTFPNPLRA